MVKHQPLQVYERQLCLSCLTGIYGCRWKRYQRSHDRSTKWECLWLFILCSTFLLLLVWCYFWWAAHNDSAEFNWLLYKHSGLWEDKTIPLLATTAACFSYVAFLTVLALSHTAVGQQLNLYWLHKVGVVAALLTTITGIIYVSQLWWGEWDAALISLQATAPFLHLAAVAVLTALAWLVAGQVVHMEKSTAQLLVLLLYLCVLLTLYVSPLAISSPCLMQSGRLGPRPDVIGQRGAPMVAPENTLLSFHKALQQRVSGLELDVAVSLDGVPFLMRDDTLRRTTDVRKLFPKRQFDDASLFTWEELSSLNAGRWFLTDDPFWTVKSLSPADLSRAANQTVCSLEEVLQLASRFNVSVLFSLRRPPRGHPRYHSWVNDTLSTVLRSGIPQRRVMWTPDWQREMVRQEASGFQQTLQETLPVEDLLEQGIVRLSLHYSQLSGLALWDLSANNVSVTVGSVNEPWLFSLLWCSGVPSVSSQAPHVLRRVSYPLWIMSPAAYRLVWILSDLISCALVVAIFVFQKWRMSGIGSYNPEQIMLSAAVRRSSRDVSLMKEKLIFSEISNGSGSADELSLCTDSGYDGYTNDIISR